MIGILGGTFDPIHNAHLRTALDVQQALGLDEIRLIPLRDPPHRERPCATAEQRLALVKAAVKDNPRLVIDERELRRAGKSYTVDTLHALRTELGTGEPICLLMGTDAFRGFPQWHQPEEILKQAHLVIMQRPGEPHPALYPERVTEDPEQLQQRPGGLILFQDVTQMDISATTIRQRVRQGRSLDHLVPQAVADIIQDLGLYR